MGETQEFAVRVRPAVLTAAFHVKRTRGDEGQEFMLVERQHGLVVAVLLEILAEPVREMGVDPADRLSETAPGQGGTATAGRVGNDHGETLVTGSGPEGGFAQAGMAEDGHPGSIHVSIGLQIVQGAGKAPSPGGKGAPGVPFIQGTNAGIAGIVRNDVLQA